MAELKHASAIVTSTHARLISAGRLHLVRLLNEQAVLPGIEPGYLPPKEFATSTALDPTDPGPHRYARSDLGLALHLEGVNALGRPFAFPFDLHVAQGR